MVQDISDQIIYTGIETNAGVTFRCYTWRELSNDTFVIYNVISTTWAGKLTVILCNSAYSDLLTNRNNRSIKDEIYMLYITPTTPCIGYDFEIL